MAKEIRIGLSEPTIELEYLIQALSMALGSLPLKEAMGIIYYLPDETDDAVTRAKIEPCIGAFVNEIIISEFLEE